MGLKCQKSSEVRNPASTGQDGAPGPRSSRDLPTWAHTPQLVPTAPPAKASLTTRCLSVWNKIMLGGEMRNLIGFKEPQEPVGLQMVEGQREWNQPRFYGGERGLRRASEPGSHALCPTSLASPAGLHCHTSAGHGEGGQVP